MESAISEKVDKVLFLIHNLQAILSFIDLKHTHTHTKMAEHIFFWWIRLLKLRLNYYLHDVSPSMLM